MLQRVYFAFLLFLLSSFSNAQPWFVRNDSIVVNENNTTLKNAWAGGLNYCQFSEIDLNFDGIKDLFAFDRTGNKIYTFLNGGTPNTVDYTYMPSFSTAFPHVEEWCLLRDYNGDGKEDIFTSTIGGIRVYKNTSTNNKLSFTLAKKLIYSNYSPTIANLYVSSVDIPSISDVDRDGDLDILTFSLGGSNIEYHQNLSKELYGNVDSLQYKVKDFCWGKVYEDPLNCKAMLNVSCKGGGGAPDTSLHITLHSGSTLLALDLNCDKATELVVGDVSCNHMYMITNGGDSLNANGIAIDTIFPANSQNTSGVNLTIFPQAFYLDVNNDGLKDLLVSPNAMFISENFNSVWWYKNTGSNCAPNFTLQQTNFLQSQMIEVGEGAYPVFFDADADGLKDLLIGNYAYYNGSNPPFKPKMALYKNTGTITKPAYTFVTRDYANLSANNLYNMMPAFGDLDNDGDQDMMIGDNVGQLYYFDNTAGGGNAANFVLSVAKYKDSANTIINVGQCAAPQIVDLDRDGRKDLIIGARNGKITYYRNVGTASAPKFKKITSALGGVNVIKKPNITGYATPFIFDDAGSYKMIVGSEGGYLYYYSNIDNNLAGAFTLVDSMYMNVWEGLRTAPTAADINSDGMLDFAIGNYSGGLGFFKGVNYDPVSTTELVYNESTFAIYPNPANEYVSVLLNGDALKSTKPVQLEIVDIAGRSIYHQTMLSPSTTINTASFNKGIYFISIYGEGIYSTKKIILAQ